MKIINHLSINIEDTQMRNLVKVFTNGHLQTKENSKREKL